MEIIRFIKDGMDIAYAVVDRQCFMTLLPTSGRLAASNREVAHAVLQHAGARVVDSELIVIAQDYRTGAYSIWQMSTRIEMGRVRIISEVRTSCPEDIILALRSQAEAPFTAP